MPIALVRSISPLPNLKIYTTISLLLVSGCLYYAFDVVRTDPHWKIHQNASHAHPTMPSSPKLKTSSSDAVSLFNSDLLSSLTSSLMPSGDDEVPIDDDQQDVKTSESLLFANTNTNETNSFANQLDVIKDVMSFMTHEPICIWTLINMAYCCLILLGKSIQKIVFGDLRISEQQHMKDKFWNFIFYKFIFVFGVVNVQYFHEVVLWVAWFSIIGFLHLLAQLCKDRFEYLSFSPTTPGWSHVRLITLLSSIFTISGVMIIVSIVFGLFNGVNTFAFMGAECLILAIRTLHVLIRYGMFLYDMRQGAINNDSTSVSWDKRGPVAYYTEFCFDLGALLVDLAHHLHMLLWSNIFLSMASLVIIMQLRYLTNEIQRKFKKHRNYLWVLNHMEKNYPLATAEDLHQNSDNCAICWEKMDTARKLPCSHLFHNSCLQSWLEQDTSCPTCRLGLSVQQNGAGIRMPSNRQPNIDIDELDRLTGAGNATAGNAGQQAPFGGRTNHFFHFNGSRYVSWLPNFSVEVSNINSVLRNGHLTATIMQQQQQQQTSQLRQMARHVQEMFPRYPLNTIMDDLNITHSIELTIDNILEDRLVVPRVVEDASAATSAASYPTANDYYITADDITTAPSVSPASVDQQYEIEQHGSDSMFGDRADLLRDDSPESNRLVNDTSIWASQQSSSSSSPPSSASSSSSGMESFGDCFSKSSREREKMLQRRKEQMLILARQRYLEKTKNELDVPSPSTSSSSSDGSFSELRHRNLQHEDC